MLIKAGEYLEIDQNRSFDIHRTRSIFHNIRDLTPDVTDTAIHPVSTILYTTWRITKTRQQRDNVDLILPVYEVWQ
jgi:hypothetical protein